MSMYVPFPLSPQGAILLKLSVKYSCLNHNQDLSAFTLSEHIKLSVKEK